MSSAPIHGTRSHVPKTCPRNRSIFPIPVVGTVPRPQERPSEPYHVPKTGGRNRPTSPATVLETVPGPGKQVRWSTPTRPILHFLDVPRVFFPWPPTSSLRVLQGREQGRSLLRHELEQNARSTTMSRGEGVYWNTCSRPSSSRALAYSWSSTSHGLLVCACEKLSLELQNQR